MPMIWFESIYEKKKGDADEDDEEEEDDENKIYKYMCPIFKTSKRTGIISSSGRSDTYVISVVNILF